MSSTICALATPPGAGGIAVVRVSGPEAYAVVEEIFTPRNPAKRVAEAKGYTAMLGYYHLRGEEMDETIALFFRAPHSYTGEDVIELSVHGGNAMAQGLLEALYLAGAAPAGPGEFTRRALENGRMSLTQAEAVMEIISAEGRQGAALAGQIDPHELGQDVHGLVGGGCVERRARVLRDEARAPPGPWLGGGQCQHQSSDPRAGRSECSQGEVLSLACQSDRGGSRPMTLRMDIISRWLVSQK